MTGYTVHTGSTQKFTEGWDRVFNDGTTNRSKSAAKATKSVKRSAAVKKKKRAGK